jgi:uncharacterized membrane protein YqjE
MSGASSGNSTFSKRLRLLVTELNRSVELRRELAELEIAHDRRLLTRSAILGALGALVAIAGLVLLLQSLAMRLAEVTQLSATIWTLIVGLVCLVPGLLLLLRVYTKTKRGFCGLRGTRAELGEDLIWLREWTGAEETTEEEA